MNPQKPVCLIRPLPKERLCEPTVFQVLQRGNWIVVDGIYKGFEEVDFVPGPFVFLCVLETRADDVEDAGEVRVYLAREVEKDGFDEAAGCDVVCLAHVFCGEDCEEVVEDDVFIAWIFGNHFGPKDNVVVQWGQ